MLLFELESMERTFNYHPQKVELEDQFILRLPKDDADNVRLLLSTKPKKIRKKLKFYLNPESGDGCVYLSEKVLKCRLRKLPTIIESLKTYNKTVFVKTADICQILDCVDLSSSSEYIHGLTAPLKNVKKKRFRKCLINRDESAVDVQKELFYLLQADLEAVSTKFEIINLENNNNNNKNNEVERYNEKSQIELFGNVLTDSEETDSNTEDVELTSLQTTTLTSGFVKKMHPT